MIAWIIRQSLRHRLAVGLAALGLLLAAGLLASRLKLDALPDLSETQVIVKAQFPGQPPQLVEDQVTYPLTAALLGVPGATTVRAVSMFGEAYVYVLFGDDVDLYWARSRILERLAQLGPSLPQGASTSLGPDASGTGWIYQYALVSRDGRTPVDRLRALQEFGLKPELQGVPGVAEVASFGGAARQLQFEVDPQRLAALGVGVDQVAAAIRGANEARGGGALEMGRNRYLVAVDARVRRVDDLLDAPVAGDGGGNAIRLRQLGTASFGPAPRESVSDLDARGDTAGGIVVMRQGENADRVLQHVHERMATLRASLPAGVEIVTTYDRSRIIRAAVLSLAHRLAEEAAVVTLVCAVFLWRLRSALVAIVALPIGLAVALAILQVQGVTANIMSLGGLAIAVGAMIDASVVMVETLHRKMERHPRRLQAGERWALVRDSALEVGPALFASLLVITASFLPVLSLTGQEGKLFGPLALTKTYAMATAAVLSITLVPVLMGLFIHGPVRREHRNPVNRILKRAYLPSLRLALARPRTVAAIATIAALSSLYPMARMGSEFMPALDEGDILYMPTTFPSVSVDEAAEILRITDAAILEMPQVASVHGKAGRSDSATDPAPLSMIETVITLKPRSQWPEPISNEELVRRLDERVRLAGLTNSWGFPIRTRIDMLTTGVKTPLALRIAGPSLARIGQLGEQAEDALRGLPGIRGVYAERPAAGRFVEVRLDRARAALHGISAADVGALLAGPVGGMPVDTLYDGRERYPIVVRFLRETRDSASAIARLRLRSSAGGTVQLSEVAEVAVRDGAAEIASENARPVGYVLLDVGDADIGTTLAAARAALQRAAVGAPGYTLAWTGQYLRLEAASARLALMTLATIAIVLAILFLHFRCWRRIGLVLASLPFAATGATWAIYLLGFHWSFATAVGMLALAGVAAEFSVVMLLYLDQAAARRPEGLRAVRRAAMRGALLRLRPKSMTVAVILGGLAPLMISQGAGIDVMRRIAAPMLGGMVTAPLFSLFVIPTLYAWLVAHRAPRPRTPTPRAPWLEAEPA